MQKLNNQISENVTFEDDQMIIKRTFNMDETQAFKSHVPESQQSQPGGRPLLGLLLAIVLELKEHTWLSWDGLVPHRAESGFRCSWSDLQLLDFLIRLEVSL